MNRTALACTTITALGLVTAAFVAAGPLSPPVGPVASTYKTLGEVEPRIAVNAANTPGDADSLFKITAPGSYYLTGNIQGLVDQHGIEITASGVTLDLNGFELLGRASFTSLDGVSSTVNGLTNIAVVNGSVRNWGGDGINLGGANATGCRVEGVRASGNFRIGIYTGPTSHIVRCSGIGGQYGIYANRGSTISDCQTSSTSVAGIKGELGSTVTNCSASDNTGDGFSIGSSGTVTNCSAYNNGGHGIGALSGGTLANCSAYNNSGHGITVSSSSTVADCTAGLNTLDGIRCTSACIIRGNTCSANGSGAGDGAGIHATLSDNRIEGNNCTSADRGIDVDAAANIIIRNTCSRNTTANWTIVANNIVGPIILAPVSIVISGDTGGAGVGTTNPWANITIP